MSKPVENNYNKMERAKLKQQILKQQILARKKENIKKQIEIDFERQNLALEKKRRNDLKNLEDTTNKKKSRLAIIQEKNILEMEKAINNEIRALENKKHSMKKYVENELKVEIIELNKLNVQAMKEIDNEAKTAKSQLAKMKVEQLKELQHSMDEKPTIHTTPANHTPPRRPSSGWKITVSTEDDLDSRMMSECKVLEEEEEEAPVEENVPESPTGAIAEPEPTENGDVASPTPKKKKVNNKKRKRRQWYKLRTSGPTSVSTA